MLNQGLFRNGRWFLRAIDAVEDGVRMTSSILVVQLHALCRQCLFVFEMK